MRLTANEKKFLRALKGSDSYAELGKRAGLTPVEVDQAHTGLLLKGAVEMRPAITNRGLSALNA